ncbi:MAG: LysR substrate-binding domain-containing protein [Pseudomonadales bacterium]
MRSLPPMTALRPFEAAARHTSFAKAGDELCLTPAAIAHQIKSLEAFLGFKLFERQHRGVSLNRAGEIYYQSIRALLEQLEQSTLDLRQSNLDSPLRITAFNAFADMWFMPRYSDFKRRYPQIDVEITANHLNVDVTKGEADVWICHSEAPPAGVEADLLLEDFIFPVCAPALLQKYDSAHAALAQSPLIYDLFWREDWANWLAFAGIAAHSASSDIQGFNIYSMVLKAATDGHGFAIGHRALIDEELARGDLVAPFTQQVSAGRHWYAVYAPNALTRPEVVTFRHWLHERLAGR